MKKILIVIGTRPNFIKVTQFKRAALVHPSMEIKMVHTGQHYDNKMAKVFFEAFDLIPDFFLNIDPRSPAEQVGEMISGLAKVMTGYKPDAVIVVGDVNSTLAGAVAANKLGIKLIHLESGLRSFDRSMPEELNRILTDEMTDHFFITEQSAYDNLIKEGKKKEQLFFVGNTMIDTMVAFKKQIDESDIMKKLKLSSKEFVLMTIHRPATVDSEEGLKKLIALIELVSKRSRIVFPIHPRTLKNAEKFGLLSSIKKNEKLILCDPLDYFSFQKLISGCKYVLTDSGGIQEETTFLKVPCLTLRNNTERPVTVSLGTNELIPFELNVIEKKIDEIEGGIYKKGTIPPHWDGKATVRIAAILEKLIS